MSSLSVEYLALTHMPDDLLQKINVLSASYNVDINSYTFSASYEEQDVDFKNSLLPLLQDISSWKTVYGISAYLKEHYKEVNNKQLIQMIIHVVPYNSALLVGLVQSNETLLKTLFQVRNSAMDDYTWQVVPLKFVPLNYIVVVSGKVSPTTDKLLEYFKQQIITCEHQLKMNAEKKKEEMIKEKKKKNQTEK